MSCYHNSLPPPIKPKNLVLVFSTPSHHRHDAYDVDRSNRLSTGTVAAAALPFSAILGDPYVNNEGRVRTVIRLHHPSREIRQHALLRAFR